MAHSLSKLALHLPHCCAAFALFANSATAQLTWSPVSVGTPPARSASAAACKLVDDDVIVFGGLGPSGPLDDTWRFTNQTWTLLSPPASPPPRSHHAMGVFGGNVALFGGRDGSGAALGDLWLWSPTAQTWAAGPAGPAAREGATANGGAILLVFGGRDGATTFGDLWRLSLPANWLDLTPATGPSPRHGHALVFVQRFPAHWLLFGGTDAAGNRLADTWRLNQSGSTFAWTQLSPASSPSPRSGHGMRWSPHRGRVQLFGGEGAAGLLGDTWEWDGASWLPITTNGAPAARADAVLVDASQLPLGTSPGLLIGGRDAAGPRAEAWQVTSTIPASTVPFGAPIPTTVTFLTLTMPWVGSSFHVDVNSLLPMVLPHVIAGFSNTTSPFGPLPINLGPAFNNMPLFVDPVVLLPAAPSGQLTLAVPTAPSLFGAHLYVQGIAFVPGLGPVEGWNATAPFDCQLGWL